MGLITHIQGWFSIQKSITVMHHIRRLKKKNYVTILFGIEKAFYKTQHLLMIKNLSEVGIVGNFPNLIRDTYEKPTANS